MNKVTLVGKIIRKKETGKVTYLTLACRNSKETEFIPVTAFQTDFIQKHFPENKWIGIEGRIHINKIEDRYVTEIIASDLFFVGDKSEMVQNNGNVSFPWEP